MNTPSLSDATAGIYTDFEGLTRLRSQASQKSPEATKEVAEQFESIFIQMMLKSMRDASQLNESTESDQTRFYQEMFDKQIALDLSSGGGIGLASVIRSQLGGLPALEAIETSPQVGDEQKIKPSIEMSWRPENPQTFIQDLWPHAKKAAADSGLTPEVLIAQSALETDWGKKIIKDDNGKTSLNLFALKADNNWEGGRAVVSTIENRDGISQRERVSFRAYGSLSESMNDYVEHMRASRTDDADTSNVNKVNTIMKQETFTQTVADMRRTYLQD